MANKFYITKSSSDLVPIYLKLPTEHIVLLKFLFESYEDLGIVRTLDAARGEVVILALTDTVEEARRVLDDVKIDFKLREIPEPEEKAGVGEDWLLADYRKQ